MDMRAIDRLVAEKILGLEVFERTVGGKKVLGIAHRHLPHYTFDIAAAWEVVEHMATEGWRFQLDREPGGRALASFAGLVVGQLVRSYAEQPTVPHAICFAALRAKGVEVPA